MAGGKAYHILDIPREFLGHNYVSSLRTLTPKNIKTFAKIT